MEIGQMKKITTLLSICLLVICGFSLAEESGPVIPDTFPGVGKASPVVKSKFFVTEAPVKNGTALVSIALDAPRNGVALVLGEPSVRAFDARSQALEPLSFKDEEMKRMNLPAANTRFNLDGLSAGRQVLTLHDIENAKFVRLVISQPESTLGLRVQVSPLAVRCGEDVLLTARIADDQLPREATVEAALPNGTTFRLNDNGQDGDVKADDGIYSGTFKAPAVMGFQAVNIRFTAEGKTYAGNDFRRNAINSVMITQPRGKIFTGRVVANPAGISVPLEVEQGNYRVEVIFGYNDVSLAYARENFVHEGGTYVVRMGLPQEARPANRAVVRLLNKDTLGLEQEIEIALSPTQGPPDLDKLAPRAPRMPESKKKAAEKMNEENGGGHHHH
jgi:hypothetical protein